MVLVERAYEVSINRDNTGSVVGHFMANEKTEAWKLARHLSAALAHPYTVRLHIVFSDVSQAQESA